MFRYRLEAHSDPKEAIEKSVLSVARFGGGGIRHNGLWIRRDDGKRHQFDGRT
jgi:hypothetical protein